MKLKTQILILTFLALSTLPLFAQKTGLKVGLEVGDKVSKKVTVDGKKVSKELIVNEIIEYNKDGKEIHGKDSHGDELLNTIACVR